jgi:hypothetical protein
LVVAEVRVRLAVSKRMVKKMDMERFNIKKLNEKEIKEKYRVTIKNKLTALKNLEDNGDIIGHGKLFERTSNFLVFSAKESIGLCESKHHKSLSDRECLKLADLREQARLQ